jgi:hypothetical protein
MRYHPGNAGFCIPRRRSANLGKFSGAEEGWGQNWRGGPPQQQPTRARRFRIPPVPRPTREAVGPKWPRTRADSHDGREHDQLQPDTTLLWTLRSLCPTQGSFANIPVVKALDIGSIGAGDLYRIIHCSGSISLCIRTLYTRCSIFEDCPRVGQRRWRR